MLLERAVGMRYLAVFQQFFNITVTPGWTGIAEKNEILIDQLKLFDIFGNHKTNDC